jgi:hypothetical protein
MYDVLMMIRPGTMFSRDEMLSVVTDVARSGTGAVRVVGDSIRIELGSAFLQVDFDHAPHVLEESREIAETLGIDCAASVARFVMFGDDPGMDLFNEHVLICERLEETGRFVLFDSAQETLFGQ